MPIPLPVLLLLLQPAVTAAIAAAAPTASATGVCMHTEDAAVAAKLVVGAAIGDGAEAQQAQRAGAHDAGLARHVQVAPAWGVGWVVSAGVGVGGLEA